MPAPANFTSWSSLDFFNKFNITAVQFKTWSDPFREMRTMCRLCMHLMLSRCYQVHQGKIVDGNFLETLLLFAFALPSFSFSLSFSLSHYIQCLIQHGMHSFIINLNFLCDLLSLLCSVTMPSALYKGNASNARTKIAMCAMVT
jgi:hypothetical protein